MGKLEWAGQIRPRATPVHTLPTDMLLSLLMHCLTLSMLQGQNQVGATKTDWLAEPKIFTTWLFTGKDPGLSSRAPLVPGVDCLGPGSGHHPLPAPEVGQDPSCLCLSVCIGKQGWEFLSHRAVIKIPSVDVCEIL